MKIRIDDREDPLDTGVESDLIALYEHLQGLDETGLVALTLLHKQFMAELNGERHAHHYDALKDHEWAAFTAVNERITAVVKEAIRKALEVDGPGVEALKLQLGAAYKHFATYSVEDFQRFLEETPEEDRLFTELYPPGFDYDSDESDLEDEENSRDHNARSRHAHSRRQARKKTTRHYDKCDPTGELVKNNMRRANESEPTSTEKKREDYGIAFKEGAGKKLSTLMDNIAAYKRAAANARPSNNPRSVKDTVTAPKKVDPLVVEIAEVFKNLWDKARWNKHVDENARIYHPKQVWTQELKNELNRVNKALSEGKDPGESPFVVAQYRGIAYNIKAFEVVGRRRSREAVELRLPVYCSAVFKAVGVSPSDYYAGVFEDDSKESREKKMLLAARAEELKRTLAGKREKKPFVHDGMTYESVAHALQNYYTVDYSGFFSSLATSAEDSKKGVPREDRTTLMEQERELRSQEDSFKEARRQWAELDAKKKGLLKEKTGEEKSKTENKKKEENEKNTRQVKKTKRGLPDDHPDIIRHDENLRRLGEEALKIQAKLDKLDEELEKLELEKQALEEKKRGWERVEEELKQLQRKIRREMFEGLLESGNPLVSTGNVPRHALRYAYALKYYTSDDGKVRLLPEWMDDDGRARHPYAGKVYVSLHPASDYRAEDGPLDVVALRTAGKIDVPDDIVAERESSFPALIPADRVVAEHIARYPSFATEYKEIYAHKYGLNQEEYESFRTMHQLISSITTRDKFFEALGEWLVRYHEARLVELARALAAEQEKILVYRNEAGLLSSDLSMITPVVIRASRRSSKDTENDSATVNQGRKERPTEDREELEPPPVDPHPSAPIIGIRNTWTQCYINSTLQLLSALDVESNVLSVGTLSHPHLAESVRAFIAKLRSQAEDGTYILEGNDGAADILYTDQRTDLIRTQLKEELRWPSIERQEDAAEALVLCLQALSCVRSEEEYQETSTWLSANAGGAFLERRPSKLHFLVAVTTTYNLKGEGVVLPDDRERCYTLDEHRSIRRVETQNLLQLSIPTEEELGEDPPPTLEQILARNWRRVYSDDESNTENDCIFNHRYFPGSKRSLEQNSFLGEPPRHLLVQLKRFTADLKKIDTLIEVGEEFPVGEARYRLNAFIRHLSEEKEMRKGHYIAYVKKGEHWYKLDDQRVTRDPADWRDAAKSAYLYLFAR